MCYVLRVTVKRLDGGGGVSSTACSGVSLASHCGSIGRLCAREYRFAVEEGGALASHCGGLCYVLCVTGYVEEAVLPSSYLAIQPSSHLADLLASHC